MGGETVPGMGEANFYACRLDLADEYCNEAIRNNPDSLYANVIKALVVGCKGDWNEALAILEPLHQAGPDFHLLTAFVGYALAKAGRPDRAQEFISRFIEMQKKEGSPPLSPLIALLYIALGDKEKFYTYYEEGMRAKMLTCLYFYNSPLLADVNGEERIKKLRREFNLPE